MKKVSNYDVAKEMGKKIGKGMLFPVKLACTSPTAVRELSEYDKKKNNGTTDEEPAVCLASVAGVVSMPFINASAYVLLGCTFIEQFISRGTAETAEALTPAIFFGTLATNVISGAYEAYRHTKNEMQEKLEKTSGKELENCVINS